MFCGSSSDDEELLSLQLSLASADLLSAPLPSNLPSPALMPLTQRPPSSLIRFDSLASIQGTPYRHKYLVFLCVLFFWWLFSRLPVPVQVNIYKHFSVCLRSLLASNWTSRAHLTRCLLRKTWSSTCDDFHRVLMVEHI